MQYNTTRGKLLLPEYGRNVQNMIAHAMELEDTEERNRAARAIIEVMGQLNPHLRDVEDYSHKLWTHQFIMADFNVDVKAPYEIPNKESLVEKPQVMPYPKSKIRFGHYGQYTQKILEGALEMDSEDEKEFLTAQMGNFMKKQFLLHNNNAVENTVIAEQLSELSKGSLEIETQEELVSTNQVLKALGISNNKSNNNNQRRNNNNRNKKKPQKRRR